MVLKPDRYRYLQRCFCCPKLIDMPAILGVVVPLHRSSYRFPDCVCRVVMSMTWWYTAKGGTLMTERRRISDENKAVAMRLLDEVINAHNVARCDDLYAPDYV